MLESRSEAGIRCRPNLEEGDIPLSVEQLLDIPTLENEDEIVKTLQESIKEFWIPEAHVFCRGSNRSAVFRYLYSFIYDSNQSLHQFVNSEVLSPCTSCVIHYIKYRRVLLRSLAAVYDQQGIESLDSEFIKWDFKRVISGLRFSGRADGRVFATSLAELLVDADRLLGARSLELEAIVTQFGHSYKDELRQGISILLSNHRDIMPSVILSCLGASGARTCNLGKAVLAAVDWKNFTFDEEAQVKIVSVLTGWAEELSTSFDLKQRQNHGYGGSSSLGTAQTKILLNAAASSRLTTIASALEDFQSNFIVHPIPSEVTVALQKLYSLIFSFLNTVGTTSILPAGDPDSLHSLLKVISLTFSHLDNDCQFLGQSGDDISFVLAILKDLFLAQKLPFNVRLMSLKAMKALAFQISAVSDLREDLTGESWRKVLNDMLELCLGRKQDVQEGGDSFRLPVRGLKRRLLLLTLGLDCQTTVPQVSPMTSEPRVRVVDEPLVLRYKVRLIPVLSQLLQSPFSSMNHKENVPDGGNLSIEDNFELYISQSFERIFDWAVADFKFELVYLHSGLSEFLSELATNENFQQAIDIPSVCQSCPRSACIIGLFPLFLQRYQLNPIFSNSSTSQALRNLVDITTMPILYRLLVEHSFLQSIKPNSFAEKTPDKVNRGASSESLPSLSELIQIRDSKLQALSDVLGRLQRLAGILISVGCFSLLNIIDRLEGLVNTRQETSECKVEFSDSSESSISLPCIESTSLQGRTSNILEIATWNIDYESIKQRIFKPVRSMNVSKVLEHPVILVAIRFICVLISSELPPSLLEPVTLLASLFSPATDPEWYNNSLILVSGQILRRPEGHSMQHLNETSQSKLLSLVTSNFIEPAPTLRVFIESIDIATDVLLEKWLLQESSLQTPGSIKYLLNSPLILFRHWMLLIIAIDDQLTSLATKVLQVWKKKVLFFSQSGKLFSDVMDVLVDAITNGWRAIAVLLSTHPLKYLSEENITGIKTGMTSVKNNFASIVDSSKLYRLFIELINMWMNFNHTCLMLPSNSSDTSNSVLNAFVGAFAKHEAWTINLVSWCVAGQAGFVKEKVSTLSKQRDLETGDLTIIAREWRSTVLCSKIQSICAAVAKGMTLTYKRYNQTLEKGPAELPLLARGELAPSMEEYFMRHLSYNKTPIEISIEHNQKEGGSTDSIIPTAEPAVPGSLYKTSQSSVILQGYRKKLPGFSFSSNASVKPSDFMLSFRRQKSNLSFRSKKIAPSLLKKVGENTMPKIKLRLPAKLPIDRTKPVIGTRAKAKQEEGAKPKIKQSPSGSPLIIPQINATLNKPNTTILANRPAIRRTTPAEGLRAMQLNNAHCEIFAQNAQIDKDKAAEEAKVGLEEMLLEILDWDMFNLDKFELPCLQEVKGRLPITFDDESCFKRAFRPLVLEECRCTLIQGGVERKLEGFPIEIVGTTRFSSSMIGTARSLVRADGAAISVELDNAGSTSTSVSNVQLRSLPFQQYDLLLLVPKEAGDDMVGGRTLASLAGPPSRGYLLAVAEKEAKPPGAKSKRTKDWEIKIPFKQSAVVAKQLRRIPSHRVAINSTWTAYVIGSLTTSVREFQSLYLSQLSSLFPFILNPKRSVNNRIPSAAESVVPAGRLPGLLPSIRTACHLNDSQTSALQHALTGPHGVCLLQGPPGTGKTKTLLALLATILHFSNKSSKHRILVCAPSNAAVDEIAARVLKEGLPSLDGSSRVITPVCVRLGNSSKITRSEVLAISLTDNVKKVSRESETSTKTEYFSKKEDLDKKLVGVEEAIHQANVLREARRFTLEFEPGDLCQEQGNMQSNVLSNRPIPDLLRMKKALQDQKMRMRDQFDKDLSSASSNCREFQLKQCDIIFSTLSGSATEHLSGVQLSYVIIDEAAQAVELSTTIPLRLEPGRMILIGDPQQLPATVLSQAARRFSYERSLFERLQRCGVEVKMLSVQYRMRPEISSFPAAHFYENRLLDASSVQIRPLLNFHLWDMLFSPFLFFEVPSRESRNSITQSLFNKEEASFIVCLIQLFVKHFMHKGMKENQQLSLEDIAIITPYKQQVNEIRSAFMHCGSPLFGESKPEVCTIDSFQGREKRIIVFSCVRSEASTTAMNLASGCDVSSVSSEDDVKGDDLNVKNERESLGFLADVRRMNVAITRARDCLWVVGNTRTLEKNPSWKALIRYAMGKPFRPCGEKHSKKTLATMVKNSPILSTLKSNSLARIHNKKKYIDLRLYCHKLQIKLRQPQFHRNFNVLSPIAIVSTFLELSEEFYLLQQRQLASTVPTSSSGVKRKLSNCSSITSSCSSQDGDEPNRPGLSFRKPPIKKQTTRKMHLIPSNTTPINNPSRPEYNLASRIQPVKAAQLQPLNIHRLHSK